MSIDSYVFFAALFPVILFVFFFCFVLVFVIVYNYFYYDDIVYYTTKYQDKQREKDWMYFKETYTKTKKNIQDPRHRVKYKTKTDNIY